MEKPVTTQGGPASTRSVGSRRVSTLSRRCRRKMSSSTIKRPRSTATYTGSTTPGRFPLTGYSTGRPLPVGVSIEPISSWPTGSRSRNMESAAPPSSSATCSLSFPMRRCWEWSPMTSDRLSRLPPGDPDPARQVHGPRSGHTSDRFGRTI